MICKAVAGERRARLLKLMAATHAGMTTEEFARIVSDVDCDGAAPARRKRLYSEMVYLPMLEVLERICARTASRPIIVSGGGVEFMRPWSE